LLPQTGLAQAIDNSSAIGVALELLTESNGLEEWPSAHELIHRVRRFVSAVELSVGGREAGMKDIQIGVPMGAACPCSNRLLEPFLQIIGPAEGFEPRGIVGIESPGDLE